jgi:hypothetical protein
MGGVRGRRPFGERVQVIECTVHDIGNIVFVRATSPGTPALLRRLERENRSAGR